MLQVVLFQPEIPPNTGNIIRLCANVGCQLHLIHPLGFNLEDKHLRRAGLDYRILTSIQQHLDFVAFLTAVQPSRLFACTTKGTQNYAQIQYQQNDAFLFGSETRGLPQAILARFPDNHRLRIPMQPHNRSLNLSNAVAVIVYEAWRQLGFNNL
jgi:tRNA (cytidine/uridine-2'-O-)-methyltransferase